MKLNLSLNSSPLNRRYLPLLVVGVLLLMAFGFMLLRGGNAGAALPGLMGIAALILVPAALIVIALFYEQSKKLRAQQEKLSQDSSAKNFLLDAIPDAYVIVGPQGQVIQKKGLEKLMNLGNAAILQDVLDTLVPASAEKLQHFLKDIQAGKEEEFRIQVTLKGSNRALAAHGVRRITESGPSALLWLRDISRFTDELRRQADMLHQANSQLGEFRALAETLPFPVWLRLRNLKISWCNPAYAAAVGSKPESVVVEQLELIPASERGGAKSLAQLAFEQGSAQTEQRYTVIHGQRRLLRLTEACVGTQRLIVGYAVDATKEAELDAELKRHVKAHEAVLDLLGTPIAIYGSDTKLKYYNRAYLKLWGADEDFLKTEPSFNEILEDLRARRRAPEQADFQKYKKERMALFTSVTETREDLMHLPDGTTLRIMAVPHPFGGLMFMHEDVTDKLALESNYNTLIAVQRETLDNLAEGIAVFGGDGKLRLHNPAFVRIWRLEEAPLHAHPHLSEVLELMRPLLGMVPDWPEFKRDTIAETLDRTTRAGRYECSDASVIEYSTVPLPDGAVLISYLDVSDSVRAELSLRESNAALAAADRLKSEFVANVSYQLRTPLNTIMGFSEILANQYFGTLNERQMEYARTMMDASKKLLHLINDVLDLATIEAGRMALNCKNLSVKALLESAADMTREWIRQQKLSISISCDDDVGSFEADEHRMKQVLFNLISNSIQYTPENGHIRLGAERQSEWVSITVEDDGMGIPEEDRERVFGKFERSNPQAKQQGAGLGLSLVKSFVELHGGRLAIDSRPGKGTRITCFLPVRASGLQKSPLQAVN
jgi:signal transduction histidine kinase